MSESEEGTETEDLQVTSSCWVTCLEEAAGAKKREENIAYFRPKS